MAKPRVFVCSTNYDLKYIRKSLEEFILEMGYEPILFESGHIPFKKDRHLDDSCYVEINHADMLALIIGGRYGSEESKGTHSPSAAIDKMYRHYNSITKNEYIKAQENNLPTFVFVESQVMAEFETYKQNAGKTDIRYAHVDSINIFKLIDEIRLNNSERFIEVFKHSSDISNWLRGQWAGLFADYLRRDRMLHKSSTLRENAKVSFQKVESLFDEPMVSFLLRNGKLNLNKEALYDNFKSANNLDEFIERMHISETLKIEVLERRRLGAIEDFKRLKDIYS